MTVLDIIVAVIVFVVQTAVVFLAATLLFDTLHYLLHRWGKSRIPLLRTFAQWHWVHHGFLDRKMRVHPELVRKNIIYHVIPEFLTSLAGCLLFLFVFPWPPVAVVALMLIKNFIGTLKEEGQDYNHMAMQRLSGQQGRLWVDQSYHAMHHIYPDNFYSSYSNVFDLIFGTSCEFAGRKFVVTGAGGAFGSAMVMRLRKLGAEVRTLKHGVDFAPGSLAGAREALEWADVLVLSHGAKSVDCDNANCRTFVELIDLFVELGRGRLTPPEVWGLGSEAEIHGDFGMAELTAYVDSKRAFARHAIGYYRSRDLIYRHIVPSAFTSAMGPGPMSAEQAVSIALFFIRRGVRYVPVTFTTLAFWNYFRFVLQKAAVNPQAAVSLEATAGADGVRNDLLR